ncbi:hypothetical protein OG921_04550 [Aldersonia sp. NBC_00410]|uniref:hypothetical protein n=1 Tax=Aldersonia sp. NBC_00410 TaxID=2975954 RepID=UPI00225B023C|nr:hypothetical protein [Aldersonia sp. NBC_00410]MCX5042444.1 hypothetical protein [Aldersonia sp. NBC_00410]
MAENDPVPYHFRVPSAVVQDQVFYSNGGVVPDNTDPVLNSIFRVGYVNVHTDLRTYKNLGTQFDNLDSGFEDVKSDTADAFWGEVIYTWERLGKASIISQRIRYRGTVKVVGWLVAARFGGRDRRNVVVQGAPLPERSPPTACGSITGSR